MPAASTRAVRFDHYGGPDVLYVADVPTPKPGPGEVLVEVRAAAINPGEAAIRSGAMDAQSPSTFPSGEGSDLAGVVVATGPDVTAWTVVQFGAMLAQPLPAGPIQEENAAEQRRIFLRGISV